MLESLSGVAGALSVGILVTVVSWLVPIEAETLAITLVLFGYIVVAATTVARSQKAGWLRTIVIVAIILAVAVGIVSLKYFFGG